jgi:uncharacterized YccA/Bax inhibitor family protein
MASPFFNEQRILDTRSESYSGNMTVSGAVDKSLLLGAILVAVGTFSYIFPNPMFLMIGGIGGLITAIVAAFRPQNANILAPLYAILKGLALGTITAIYAAAYSGIVFQAITLTIGILFAMLFLYKSGTIKVTASFRTGVTLATIGIFLLYLLTWILSFFNVNVPFIHEGGTIGIVFSLFVVGLASMNLLIDFDNFYQGERLGAPKYMEWYSAMALLITIVWLYIEILRLLAKLSSRD